MQQKDEQDYVLKKLKQSGKLVAWNSSSTVQNIIKDLQTVTSRSHKESGGTRLPGIQ